MVLKSNGEKRIEYGFQLMVEVTQIPDCQLKF